MKRAATAVYLSALGIWVGGMAVLGLVVAPAIFRTVQSRLLAGTTFGTVLERFGWVQIVLGVVCLAALGTLAATKAIGGRAAAIRLGVVGVMLALVCFTQFHLIPEVTREREKIANFDAVPSGVPLKARFDGLHKLSVRVSGATLLLGLGLLAASTFGARPPDGA